MTFKRIVAIQMNPIESIKIITDTSFALGLEAQKRGFELFYYLPENLSYRNGEIIAQGHFIEFIDDASQYFKLKSPKELNLAEADYVLIRQDPPFDMAYITTTHLLELLPKSTLVLNDPIGIRNAPEKLIVTHFQEMMPPTIFTKDLALIEEFREQQGTIVIKPLYDFGGNGVFKISPDDGNVSALVELYQRLYKEPFIVQKYIEDVKTGDKRIILIGGDPVGVFKRVPGKGQARSNVRIGGTPEAYTLSKRDMEICQRIKPRLLQMGIHLAGIDVIGDYLTEINVTSPTGMRMMNRMYNLDLAVPFWDGAEALRQQRIS